MLYSAPTQWAYLNCKLMIKRSLDLLHGFRQSSHHVGGCSVTLQCDSPLVAVDQRPKGCRTNTGGSRVPDTAQQTQEMYATAYSVQPRPPRPAGRADTGHRRVGRRGRLGVPLDDMPVPAPWISEHSYPTTLFSDRPASRAGSVRAIMLEGYTP